jgi:hypothetical protein
MRREQWVTTIREMLGQMIESGDTPDEADFDAIKATMLRDAPDADRSIIETITWDEVHEDLWE